MNDLDAESMLVLDALKEAFDDVAMRTPASQLVAAGRARRHRRRLVKATGLTATAALVLGALLYGRAATGPTAHVTTVNAAAGTPSVHIRTVAYGVKTQSNGTVEVTWTKDAYFQDPAGLEAALRGAGFPVMIKVGEFCKGPKDDGYLDASGQGHGVDQVMQSRRESDQDVVFSFVPSAMPAGMQLFIGYLSPSQLAVTQGRPGSVERLVPTATPLTCTTVAPPAQPLDHDADRPDGSTKSS
jgi:hypothetical protein